MKAQDEQETDKETDKESTSTLDLSALLPVLQGHHAHDWQVVLQRRAQPLQVVLYSAQLGRAAVARLPSPAQVPRRHHHREAQSEPNTNTETCPECGCRFACHFAFTSSDNNTHDTDSDADAKASTDYFRLLDTIHANDLSDPPFPALPDPHAQRAPQQPTPLSKNAFNQGYYDRFFIQTKKLGRGLRGSVFLVQHVLDTVYLGDYAVKSIPIGSSHSWLVRQLQEVHLLEKLRHPNIIHYKHAWIENRQLSVFGPEVPCLFILMELANGGSLEDYIYLQHDDSQLDMNDDSLDASLSGSASSLEQRMHRKNILRQRQQQQQNQRSTRAATNAYNENLIAKTMGGIGTSDVDGKRVRFLTRNQIWALFLDVCEGLAHLHRNGIIHRGMA
ncbi:putative serine/threonine-protein kinase iks1 [Podochytrium sp. JEL0797]|nr:putative serine/threonine-protein kinase iks1 [Podochytrium sp. JEL0797]